MIQSKSFLMRYSQDFPQSRKGMHAETQRSKS